MSSSETDNDVQEIQTQTEFRVVPGEEGEKWIEDENGNIFVRYGKEGTCWIYISNAKVHFKCMGGFLSILFNRLPMEDVVNILCRTI